MKKFLRALVVLGLVAMGLAWWLTAPERVDRARFDNLEASPERGEFVFAAGGCASCHAAPDTDGAEKLILAGGKPFASDFGTFYAPNISPVKLRDWLPSDLANAMIHGTSPQGTHYYPAFPFSSYRNISAQDVADLLAYIQTLPDDATPDRPHDVGFPFNIRRSLGGWKFLFLTDDWVTQAQTEEELRGRYLVEVLGHCAECHTPRNVLGGLDRSAWLEGAPHPSGKGVIPALTPDKLGWSAEDIAIYLESGFTPDFDSAGGEMVEVIENMAQLPAEDRQAIAAYLIRLGG